MVDRVRQYSQWKEIYSTENVTLKNEQGTLKAKYALEVQNHAKTTALLADEKAAKKELQTARHTRTNSKMRR